MKPFMDLSDNTFLQMYSLDRSVPLAYRMHKLADYTWHVERDAMGEDHLLLSLVSRTSRLEEVLLNGEPAMEVFEAAPLLDGQDRAMSDAAGAQFISFLKRNEQELEKNQREKAEVDMPLLFLEGDRIEIDNGLVIITYSRDPSTLPSPTQGPLITRRDQDMRGG